MTNPFDDVDARFHVVVNDENQHSLWPVRLPVPDGWTVVLRDETRDDCLAHIDRAWTDMRPRSLADAMDASAAGDS